MKRCTQTVIIYICIYKCLLYSFKLVMNMAELIFKSHKHSFNCCFATNRQKDMILKRLAKQQRNNAAAHKQLAVVDMFFYLRPGSALCFSRI